MTQVVGAQTTVRGTRALFHRNIGCQGTLSVEPECTKSLVHLKRPKIKLLDFAMFRACLPHKDLLLSLKDGRRQDLVAIWTDTLGESDELFSFS